MGQTNMSEFQLLKLYVFTLYVEAPHMNSAEAVLMKGLHMEN